MSYAEAMALVDAGEARPQVTEIVGLLRRGLSVQEAADRLGIARSTAYQRLNDPTDERNHARKLRHYGTCLRCGGRTSYRAGGTADLCLSCHRADIHETAVAWIVAEIHHWAELYGCPPSAPDWSLAAMRWRERAYAEGRTNGRFSEARIAELERRHREDGPWPATNTAVRVFGSWSAAIEAAGFEPMPVSGGRRKAAA